MLEEAVIAVAAKVSQEAAVLAVELMAPRALLLAVLEVRWATAQMAEGRQVPAEVAVVETVAAGTEEARVEAVKAELEAAATAQ